MVKTNRAMVTGTPPLITSNRSTVTPTGHPPAFQALIAPGLPSPNLRTFTCVTKWTNHTENGNDPSRNPIATEASKR